MSITKAIILTTLVLSAGCSTKKTWKNTEGSIVNQESLSIAMDECNYGVIKKQSNKVLMSSIRQYYHQTKQQQMTITGKSSAKRSKFIKKSKSCMKSKGFEKK